MADSLPSVDFGFNDLRERMTQFTQRFDEFIERGRKRVLEERNAFRMNVAELEGKMIAIPPCSRINRRSSSTNILPPIETQRTRRQAIINLESQSTSHAETLQKETAETAEMHAAISTLTHQKTHHETHRSALQSEIAATQATIRARREAQAAHQRALDAQARYNLPELKFWETCLGLRIEGAGESGGERLRFCFEELGAGGELGEGWFEIDTGAVEFVVVATKPKLEREEVEGAVERANEGRDLVRLLKGMRGLFVEALRG